MTWTKTGSEYVGQCDDADLSDAAYRTHHEVISWLYNVDREHVTDLSVPKRKLRQIANSTDHEQAVKELIACGFWHEHGDHIEIIHHADVIKASLVAQRNQRLRNKRAQQAHRNRQPKIVPEPGDDP